MGEFGYPTIRPAHAQDERPSGGKWAITRGGLDPEVASPRGPWVRKVSKADDASLHLPNRSSVLLPRPAFNEKLSLTLTKSSVGHDRAWDEH